MKRLVTIIFCGYFLLGFLLLEQSDFSILQDLPSMYQHCKTAEDKDLTPLDFITDHLLNFDCLFDQHDNGDPQKPHVPPQFNHQSYQNIFVLKEVIIQSSEPVLLAKNLVFYSDNKLPQKFISSIFRPPICHFSDFPLAHIG